ncbi:hypothetical protein [Alteromonas sp.]|uniref:hypothetical protein n=1 Tax=Alteromonas sp. TaxID=232 RepID=UPI000B6407C3|nr:hypothetical protein [Alteromonas sp.]MAI36505.1 hypothetical protein [Alteromonas sp.]OUX91132.1 MAG: hypothetical protein CBB95_02850 [Alteromonas sp. TMED35]|tara:strand:+ start:11082 stop:11405 length:324 start_codon:yes stop_codon:yes gene_type:complete
MDKSFTEFSVFCGSRNPYKVIKNNAAKNRLWKARCKKHASIISSVLLAYSAKSTKAAVIYSKLLIKITRGNPELSPSHQGYMTFLTRKNAVVDEKMDNYLGNPLGEY